MTKRLEKKGEYLETKAVDRLTYHYIDTSRGINIKSKEEYPKLKKVVHFPFEPTTGEPRYQKITEIVYKGMPAVLPRGIVKNANKGYGFTRILRPLLYSLATQFDVYRIVVKPKGKLEVKGKVAYMGYDHLDKFYPKMDSLLKTQSKQKDVLVNGFLRRYFPKRYRATKTPYVKGAIYSIISDDLKNSDISKEDYDAMANLVFSKLDQQGEATRKVILKTRERIEERFLEDAIKDYRKLLLHKQDGKNLEKRWENFFKNNSWIISNLFSLPVLLFANQAYVGGKEIFNANGKVTDFLFRNKLTDNLSLIELKTHKTPLLANKPYRGNDVYALSGELSGAINQVLDQKQNLMNDLHALRSKAGQQDWFESLNSRCLIIVGSVKSLPKNGKRSFEIFRNNLHGVEIVTFDEVLEKIVAFSSLIKKDVSKKRR